MTAKKPADQGRRIPPPLLMTKVNIPPSLPSSIKRKRLFHSLNTGFKCNLCLVSAPPGCGKTTLLSDWIRKYNIPCAWYSIDENDNDPGSFLTYIIAALQSVERNTGLTALDLLQSPQSPSYESIMITLLNSMNLLILPIITHTFQKPPI